MAEPSHRDAYTMPGTATRALPESMDSAVICELRDMDRRNPGVLDELIARFIAHERAFLAAPQLRTDALDLGFLRANAHRLKGSAGSLGARTLAECAGRLERAAVGGDCAEISALIDLLRAEFAAAALLFDDAFGAKS